MENQEVKASDLRSKTTVYATKKAPFHKEGEEIVAHPETAKYFIKHGYATESAGKQKA